MATPTIPNSEEQFFNILYEGNGGGQRVGKFVPFTDNGTIDNSCIFNSADNAYLSRTPGSAGNRKTFTVSFWAKRGLLGDQSGSNTYGQRIFHVAASSSAFFDIKWSGTGDTEGANRLHIREYSSSAEQIQYWTNRTFEDTSKWYHILLQVDTTQSTSTDRIKLYVDGDQVTSWYRSSAPSLNFDTLVNSTVSHQLGRFVGATTNNLDGYLAEFNLVDGSTVAPSTFGVTDTSTGRWIPKTLSGITYGTNGFRMKFQDSSALGDDTSGNGNDFTATNLASTDQTTDSPTQNHATVNPNTASNSSITFAEGNTHVEMNNVYPGNVLGTLGASSGKYYWEVTISGTGSSANGYATGVAVAEWSKVNSDPGSTASPFSSYIDSRSLFFHNAISVSNSTTFTAGDVIGIALNLDDSEISYFKNNTIVGSAQPLVEGQTYFPFFKNSTTVADLRYTVNFGQKSWNYTAPTGYVALQQDNLPETDKGISGLVWIKSRDTASAHMLFDSSRGPQLRIKPDSTSSETTSEGTVSKFLKGGYAVGDQTAVNKSGDSVVGWNWVANAGTTASNTNGSITSTVQVNQTAGFSIVKWTSTGSNATVGHGLSTAPSFILGKVLTRTDNWIVGHHKQSSTPWNNATFLSVSDSQYTSAAYWNNTAPTSTVFTTGTWWYSSENYIAYCWHEVDGFSKFGKYTGNGSADGPFVYTGFRPAWIMIKNAGATASWFILDAARNTFNPVENWLVADDPQAEVVTSGDRKIDFLSNGFKIRATTTDFNGSSGNMIYMAFAEHPFVGNGTSPVTAR